MQLRVIACILLGLVVVASAGMYNSRSGYKKSDKPFVGRVTQPLPSEYIKAEDLPKNWDWRNVTNVNYVSWSRNQHIPTYCGGCWSFATTSALSDRLAIQNKNAFPEINLAPQALINCEGGGDCDGGDPGAALQYIAQTGIPDETCAPYQAVNGLDCTPTCKTCWPTGCATINNYNLYTVSDYNQIAGVADMKAEIFARGPIACLVDATDRFEQYTGGIYSEYVSDIEYDHVISVVGWGVSTDGTEYWIGRNSWGTYWGEHGWFKIVLGRPNHNLGIEGACYWGVPTLMSHTNQITN